MFKVISFIVSISVVALVVVFALFRSRQLYAKPLVDHAHNLEDIAHLFPTSIKQIKTMKKSFIADVQKQLDEILAIPADERTFTNTAQALDSLVALSDFAIGQSALFAIKYMHPDDDLRKAAEDALLEMQSFYIDNIATNKTLYRAFNEYVEGNAQKESLTDAQRYFLNETLEDFKRAGLYLPKAQLDELKRLKKELSELSMAFGSNIAQDNSTVVVTKEGLDGVSDDFVASLKKTDDGTYILRVDYPTRSHILEHCTVEDTRKRWYKAFVNRAYPVNEAILSSIIDKRDEMAKILGFDSYAAYDTANQMVKTPERAHNFIIDLLKKSRAKEEQEIDELINHLPDSVTLTKDGRIKPWDFSFIKAQYKKKHLAVDELALSEYFPTRHTIDRLLDIYEQFMGLQFEMLDQDGFWHDEVQVIRVYKKGGKELLGTLLLDLFPRENKYSHAAHATIIPSVQLKDKTIPAVSAVIANFPRETKTKPSLMMRTDVSTFFHEFGHALHALLGRTALASQSGTNVKRDFVELPSQMLEEWLWEKEIIKHVSHHYKTGESLKDNKIRKLVRIKNFATGNFVQTQGLYSLLSLSCFSPGEKKDIDDLFVNLVKKYRTPKIAFDDENHMYTAFGHLTGYGARYYGYLWSKVFAIDVFKAIGKKNVLNGEVGRRYVECILAPGGSKDPEVLLKEFLGRKPTIDAFIEYLGL